jgi:hypothetical protein
MQTLDTPNIVLPLASSINERGVAGYTHSITNSEDQRKINCFYEPVKNAATGKGTLTLSKRPGVTIDSQSYGDSTQQTYLLHNAIAGGEWGAHTISNNTRPWTFSKLGNDIRNSFGGTTTVIFTSGSGFVPVFVDTTAVANVPYVVLQTRTPSATTAQRVWYAASSTVWTEITDADFVALVHRGKMEHLDGFAFILTNTNLIFNSDSNSLANWTNTSFLAKQIQQDYANGLARYRNQILAFGDETVEVFYNAGNTTGSPLGRIATLHQRIGLVPTTFGQGGGNTGGTNYYTTINDRMYFVGRKYGSAATVGVFSYDGQNFDKVSTPYIDKILGEKIDVSGGSYSYYSINKLGHHGQVGVSICLTAPSSSTQIWLMFYPEWKEWFEWNSTVFSPVNSGEFFIGLGTNNNKVYHFPSSDNWQDDGTSYAWDTQFRLPTNGSQRKFMLMYGVDADTDTAGLGNTLTVELSTDDSQTFSTLGTIDLTQDRKILTRGGSFRKGHIRLGNTNSRPTRIHNFLARIE